MKFLECGCVIADNGVRAWCSKQACSAELSARPASYGACPTCGSDSNERDELIKAEREIERLTGALKKANDQAEHFERAWYLRGDDLEQALALLKRYRDETPLGHQPHMIAHEVDEVLGRVA